MLSVSPNMIRDLKHLMQPEPMDAPPMTHEQLYDVLRRIVPERCELRLWIYVAENGRAEVEVSARLDGRSMYIDECATCEEALAAFKANVETLRFGVEVVA